MIRVTPRSTLFPYTTLFRSVGIQNTLREASKLNLVHAGIGNTLDEAVAPGYLYTPKGAVALIGIRSEEHTSELQSRQYLVCRLLLEKKKKTTKTQKSQK